MRADKFPQLSKAKITSVGGIFFVLFALLLDPAFAGISSPSTPGDGAVRARVVEAYGKLPLSFVALGENADGAERYLARGKGYTLLLTPQEAVVQLFSSASSEKAPSGSASSTGKEAAILRLRLQDANPNPKVTGENELPGKVNFLHGKDPLQWKTHLPTYARVKYAEVYPGVDLVYYGNPKQLEYDFHLAPGTDPSRIRFSLKQDAAIESLYAAHRCEWRSSSSGERCGASLAETCGLSGD